MQSRLKQYWPLWTALGVLTAIVIALYFIIESDTGRLIYLLDDAYIHMAIARHLVEDGVYGVTRYEFSAASSSISWPFLLTGSYLVAGVNEWTPLIINIILAVGLVAFVAHMLRQWMPNAARWYHLLTLLVFVVAVPLPVLVFVGMEHLLHTAVTFPVLYLAVNVLTAENPSRRDQGWLLFWTAILAMTRYEALLTIAIVGSLFLMKRDIKYMVAMGIAAAIPVGVFGLYLVSNGDFLLPNSVMIKGGLSPVDSIISNIQAEPFLPLSFVVITAYLLRYCRGKTLCWDRISILSMIYLAVGVFHFLFSKFGWFFRYEAYLVAMAILLFSLIINDTWQRRADRTTQTNGWLPRDYLVGTLIVLSVIGLGYRAYVAHTNVKANAGAIYRQQYQMAMFIDMYYGDNERVAINDIGYIGYLTDNHIVDLTGLANNDIAHLRLDDELDEDSLLNEIHAKNAHVAIVYESWFEDQINDQWQLVGTWKIDRLAYLLGDTVVSFYAFDEAAARELHDNLEAFALPDGVTYVDYYAVDGD